MKINQSKSENNETIILSIEEFGKLIKHENLQLEKSKLKEYNYSNDDTNDSVTNDIVSKQRNKTTSEEKNIFSINSLLLNNQKITIQSKNKNNSIFQNFSKVRTGTGQIRKMEKVENPFLFKRRVPNEKIVMNFNYDD